METIDQEKNTSGILSNPNNNNDQSSNNLAGWLLLIFEVVILGLGLYFSSGYDFIGIIILFPAVIISTVLFILSYISFRKNNQVNPAISTNIGSGIGHWISLIFMTMALCFLLLLGYMWIPVMLH